MGNTHLKWTDKCVCGEGGGGQHKAYMCSLKPCVLLHIFCFRAKISVVSSIFCRESGEGTGSCTTVPTSKFTANLSGN